MNIDPKIDSIIEVLVCVKRVDSVFFCYFVLVYRFEKDDKNDTKRSCMFQIDGRPGETWVALYSELHEPVIGPDIDVSN